MRPRGILSSIFQGIKFLSSGVVGEMPATNPAGKSLEIEAQNFLKNFGYQAYRLTGESPIDVMAWNTDNKILCILIRSSRNVTISGSSQCINPVIELLQAENVPGKCEFWVKYPGMWKRYEILKGGIVPIEDGRYDRINPVST